MTTASIIISILFIVCLTVPAGTHSLGLLKADDKPSQRWLIPFEFGITQGVAVGIGYNLGRLFGHMFAYIADYMVFAVMLVVAVKMFVDSMKMLKGKMLYTVSTNWDIFSLTILAAMNTLLMSLMGFCFMPFDFWYILLVALAGFLWSAAIVGKEFTPDMIKKMSFIEFSASVFMVVIAILYLFTDLI